MLATQLGMRRQGKVAQVASKALWWGVGADASLQQAASAGPLPRERGGP